MQGKRILCPDRLRRVPKQFSWVDHRFVRDSHIRGLSHAAMGLYLFLVTVGDAEGLSYYSDRSAGRLLGMDTDGLCRSRSELCRAGLIAYEPPLYQVLGLDEPRPGRAGGQPGAPRPAGSGGPVSIGEVIGRLIGEQA